MLLSSGDLSSLFIPQNTRINCSFCPSSVRPLNGNQKQYFSCTCPRDTEQPVFINEATLEILLGNQMKVCL